MRVLVACEFSGIVRDAFCQCGHTAVSADILPSVRTYCRLKNPVNITWGMSETFSPMGGI